MGNLTAITMEIPAGIFADRYGKRLSLVLAALFSLFYVILLILGNGFLPFVIASFLFGISNAFYSGTMEALLFDSLAAIGRQKSFMKTSGRVRFWVQALNATALMTAPFFYAINKKLPFMIMAAFFMMSALMAYMMKEPPIHKDEDKMVPLFTFHGHLKEAFFQLIKAKYVLAIVSLFVIVTSFQRIMGEFTQPLLEIAGLDIVYFGFFYFVLRFIQGVAAEMAHRLNKHLSLFKLLFFGVSFVLFSFALIGFAQGYVIMIAIIMMNVGYWIFHIPLMDEVNQSISSTHRTTILSLNSFFENGAATLVILVFSVFADINGIQEIMIYATVILVVLAGLGLINMQKRKKSK